MSYKDHNPDPCFSERNFTNIEQVIPLFRADGDGEYPSHALYMSKHVGACFPERYFLAE